ncbi:MAG TPA: hypothetical protein VGS57_05295 [Thermoanaerobaculia bacterium]|jgi:tetratricopeptide (TPR) repeat protein|nr:hypothetical protein [Thermoanaerobaculia bacterium]
MTSRRRQRSRAAKRARDGGKPRPQEATAAPQSAVESSRLVAACWLAAASLAFLPLAFYATKATDLWWHLAAGDLMLARHQLVRADPWSFASAGATWLNHEWLADVVYASWTRAFGISALAWWLLGILVLSFVLLFDLLRRLSGNAFVAFLATLFAMALSRPLFEPRPHLYTLLGVVLTLRWASLRRRPFVVLPVLFLLWANFHGGAILGLLPLALVLAGRARTDDPERRLWWRAAVALWLGCALATLCTPYGLAAVLYPFRYAFGRSPSGGLREWRSPFSPLGLQVPLYSAALVLLVVAALAVLGQRRWRRDDPLGWPALAFAVLTAAMSARSARFVPYFAIALALVLTAAAAPWLHLPRRREAAVAAPLIVLAAGGFFTARLPLRHAFDLLVTREVLPVDSCDFLNRNGISGRVLTYYGWGGYVIWCGEGRLRPFVDSRADTVYGAATLATYQRFQDFAPGWESVPRRVGADFVLWPALPSEELPVLDQARGLVRTGDWRLLYQDFGSTLLVRSDLALPPLVEPPDSAYHRLAQGSAALHRARFAEAERYFESALDADQGLVAACRNLALVQARQGKADAAWATHRRCERIYPEPEAVPGIEAALEHAAGRR